MIKAIYIALLLFVLVVASAFLAPVVLVLGLIDALMEGIGE
jgi:hypothetical protein